MSEPNPAPDLAQLLPGFDRERARITAQHANTSVGPSACNVIVDAVVAYFEPLVRALAEERQVTANLYAEAEADAHSANDALAAERAARQVAEAALRQVVAALREVEQECEERKARARFGLIGGIAHAALAAPSAARAQAESEVLRAVLSWDDTKPQVDIRVWSEQAESKAYRAMSDALDRLLAVEAAEQRKEGE